MKKVIHSGWDKEEESDVYSSDFRDELIDDGEMDSWEAGFMAGYDEAG